MTNQKPLYKLAKLCDHGGDISKQWYVYFYLLDPKTFKYKQYREFISRTLKTKVQMRAAAKELVTTIDAMLEAGIISYTAKSAEYMIEHVSVASAIEKYFKYKEKHLSDRTLLSYRHACEKLLLFLDNKGYGMLLLKDFKPIHAAEFVTNLSTKKITAKTINGYTGYLKSIFDDIASLGLCDHNPFGRIKSLKVRKSEKILWSDEQKKVIVDYLKEKEPGLFLIFLLVYRGFIRPKEISLLQVKDIDLVRGLIRVSSLKDKSGTGGWVTLTNQLINLLTTWCKDLPGQTYLFSKGLKPGATFLHRNSISARFKVVREKLNLPAELKLYSFKHTGNSQLYFDGTSTEVLKLQNRHSGLAMTEIYIKMAPKVIQEIRDLPDV